jgi:chromosome segregation ATPase
MLEGVNLIDLITVIISLVSALAALGVLFKVRDEKNKLRAEAKNLDTESMDRVTTAATKLLEPYQNTLTRLEQEASKNAAEIQKTREEFKHALDAMEECKDRLRELIVEVSRSKEDKLELLAQNADLNRQLKEQAQENIALKTRVLELESTVKALIEQIESSGLTPNFGRRTNDV